MTHFIWDGSPILFSLGPLAVRWYGLLFASGFLIGSNIMNRMLARDAVEIPALDTLFVYVIVGSVIGARLAHTLIYEPDTYLANPLLILKVWEGGLASHGGAVGVLTGCWLWKRRHWKNGSLLVLFDYLCVPSTLAGALIRIGNFFNSEIIGSKSEVPWAIVFKKVDEFPRHPSMLYESISYVIIFGILLFMFKLRLHIRRVGLFFGSYLALVFSARFIIEFVKEPQVTSEIGKALDFGQLLSIPFILIGIGLIVRACLKRPSWTPPAQTASKTESRSKGNSTSKASKKK